MSQHARLGPSSAHRWLLCPASIQLSEQVPHRESGSAAAAGNLMHSVFERRMLDTGDFLAQELLALAALDMSEVRARLIVNQGVEAAHTALANYQITEYLTECRVKHLPLLPKACNSYMSFFAAIASSLFVCTSRSTFTPLLRTICPVH